MNISQQAIDRFRAQATAALKLDPSDEARTEWTAGERVLREILFGNRRLWVEVHYGGQTIAYAVETLEELREAALFYPLPRPWQFWLE